MLQIQLKLLKESCTFLKWGRAQEMLHEGFRCQLRKVSTVLELGKDLRQKQPEALTTPSMLKTPLKSLERNPNEELWAECQITGLNLGQNLKERFICLPGSRQLQVSPRPSVLPSREGGHETRNSQQGAELHLELQLPTPNPLCSSSCCLHRSSLHLDRLPLPPGSNKDPTFLLPLWFSIFLSSQGNRIFQALLFCILPAFCSLLVCPPLCL